MRRLIVMAALSACGVDDGVADFDIDEPHALTTCPDHFAMCEQACVGQPPAAEQKVEVCVAMNADASPPQRTCIKTFRVNHAAGCCGVDSDGPAVVRWFECQ